MSDIRNQQGGGGQNQPPRPRVEDTQEFRAAVDAAVAKATEEILSKISAAQASTGNTATDETGFARALAIEIAKMTDQGTGRKRISTEEALKREVAYERMQSLVIDYRARGITPEYELKAATHLDEQMIAPTYTDRNHVQRKTQIGWPGFPNEAMEPINDAAVEIFTAYREYLGGASPKVTHATGKGGSLRVMHKPDGGATPAVGKPRGGDLAILGRDRTNEVVETAVLGTIARPARQLA